MFMTVCGTVLLIMRNVSRKVVEIIKTQILCSITFSENRAIYKTMWKHMVQTDRPQMAYEAHAHFMLDDYGYRHKHSEYSKHIFFFHGNNGYANASKYYVYTSNARLVCYLPSVESNDNFQGRLVTAHRVVGVVLKLALKVLHASQNRSQLKRRR